MANSDVDNLAELTIGDTGGGDVYHIVDLTGPTSKFITQRNAAKITITRDMWIGAERFISTTTNGAAINDLEHATNDVMTKTADFSTSTSESVQFWHTFEEKWNAGTVTFKLVWSNAGGSAAQTIDFDLAARSYANDEAIDQATGTAQNVTDTFLAQGDIHITAFSSAITISGASDAEPINFKLSRDVASDDLAGDCQVIGLVLRYTVTDLASS